MTMFVGNEVTVNTSTGEAYISQRKAEELLGLPSGTLRSWLSRNHQEANTINGLDAKLLQLATTYYAIESRAKTSEALSFLVTLSEAGAKAFLYHEAGYVMEAKKPEQELSLFDSLSAGFARMAQVEREQSEQKTKLFSLEQRTEAVEARQSAIIDQSSYFSVLAYAISNGFNMTTGQASGISRKCGKLSKDLGSTIGTIVDPRFGSVKTYHESILHEVFTSKGYNITP